MRRSLAPTLPRKAGELGPLRGEPQPGLLDGHGVRQGVGPEGDVVGLRPAAGRDAVVLAALDPGLARPERRVGRDGALQLLDALHRHRPPQGGQVQRPGHPQIHVGVRDGGPERQGEVDRILADDGVQGIQRHHGAVQVAAGVRRPQVERQVAGREGEVGIAEAAAPHRRLQLEPGERAPAPAPLHPARQGHGAGRLHRRELLRVQAGHQGEEAADVVLGARGRPGPPCGRRRRRSPIRTRRAPGRRAGAGSAPARTACGPGRPRRRP